VQGGDRVEQGLALVGQRVARSVVQLDDAGVAELVQALVEDARGHALAARLQVAEVDGALA
jgi:hypothetical protein